MSEDENRRPIASRNTGWAMGMTRWLAATSITPNQVSQGSVLAAAIAGAAFWASGQSDGALSISLLVGAALFCQIRLICNLLDGMVAVEAGKSAPDGAFWNEMPDRIADILILIGAGLAVGDPALGWAAAAFAVLTAYVRELGRASGMTPDFGGPMAKPHRMAVMTLAALGATLEPLWDGRGQILTAALYVVAAGALLTTMLRCRRILGHMRT